MLGLSSDFVAANFRLYFETFGEVAFAAIVSDDQALPDVCGCQYVCLCSWMPCGENVRGIIEFCNKEGANAALLQAHHILDGCPMQLERPSVGEGEVNSSHSSDGAEGHDSSPSPDESDGASAFASVTAFAGADATSHIIPKPDILDASSSPEWMHSRFALLLQELGDTVAVLAQVRVPPYPRLCG